MGPGQLAVWVKTGGFGRAVVYCRMLVCPVRLGWSACRGVRRSGDKCFGGLYSCLSDGLFPCVDLIENEQRPGELVPLSVPR